MNERIKTIALWTITGLLLGGCVLGLYLTGFFEAASSPEHIRAYIEHSAPWSHLVFFFLQLLTLQQHYE